MPSPSHGRPWGPDLARVATGGGAATPELRRIVSRIGRLRVHGTVRVFAALWAATRAAGEAAPTPAEVARLASRMLTIAWRDPIALGDLAVSGSDLQETGIKAGPALGRILQSLLDRVLTDPALNTNAQLLVMARQLEEET